MYWKPPFLKAWEWGLSGLGVEGVTETLFSEARQNVALVVVKCVMVLGGTWVSHVLVLQLFIYHKAMGDEDYK